MVAAPGGRPGGRHADGMGDQGRLLRRRRGGPGLQPRAQVPRHPPEGGVQLAGLVQHRRPGRAAAGERLLHPLRRGQDGLDPQLVHRGGHHLQGRLRRRGQPLADPLVARAAEGRRHGVGPGQLHARRRRLGGHHQVRWQDPPGRQDGHPRRRPPRRRGLHLVQGDRGAQGPRAARRRLRHGPRRGGQPLDAVPERQQLGPGDRRVHGGRHRRPRLEPDGTRRTARSSGPCRPATCSARSPTRPGSAPTRACSTTPPSTAGTRRRRPVASTAPTRAASTCTSTTRPATWPP